VVDGRSRAVACATHFLGGQTAAETAASFNWANGAICADTSINRFSMAKGQEIITMGNGRTRGPNGQQQQGIGQMGQPTKWPKLPNNSAAFAAANDDDDRNGTLVDMLEMGQKEAKIGQVQNKQEKKLNQNKWDKGILGDLQQKAFNHYIHFGYFYRNL
jgi:hypothetical protein